MSMTIEEAKRLWCPFSRVSLYHRSTDANRMVRYGSGEGSEDHIKFQEATRCIADGCAAWRFSQTGLNDVADGYEPEGSCGLVDRS